MKLELTITIDDEDIPVEVEVDFYPEQKGSLFVEPIQAGYDIESAYLKGTDTEVYPLTNQQTDEINNYIEYEMGHER